jgi:hypothetical protein
MSDDEKILKGITCMKEIGIFTSQIINLLELNISPGTPIFIGDSNIEHIRTRHPYEYDKYFDHIEEIIAAPDYIGQNPKDASILFVKLYKTDNEYVRIAVKITSSGKCYAKTLHILSTCNAERYLEKGTLKSLTNQQSIV